MSKEEFDQVLQILQQQYAANLGNRITDALAHGLMVIQANLLTPLIKKEEETK